MKKYLVFNLKDEKVVSLLGTIGQLPPELELSEAIITLPKEFMMGRSYWAHVWTNSHGKHQVAWLDLDSKPLAI